MTLQLGWFSTARGPGSRGMLVRAMEAMDSGALDARIQFVFSNRERGEGEGSDAYFDLLEARGTPWWPTRPGGSGSPTGATSPATEPSTTPRCGGSWPPTRRTWPSWPGTCSS